MRNQGVGSWPARRARMTPHRAAIVHESTSITYGELQQRVTRLAHALRGLGVRRGDRVAYLGLNRPELAETLFATGVIGAIFVPLNTRLAAPELAFILKDAGAEVLLWDSALAETVSALRAEADVRHQIRVGARNGQSGDDGGDSGALIYDELLAEAPADPIDDDVELDDVCMIQYTSGTSGRPKGVMLTHANITWNCYNILLDVDVAQDEVSLVSAPMFHTAALNQLFLPTVLKGGTSVLMSRFDPDRAFDLIVEHRVTWMFGVTAMFLAMVQSPRWPDADLSSVRTLMCGGAPVPEALIRTYQDRGLVFLQGYGLTETSPGALFLRAAESTEKIGSAGTACFFTDVRVVRPDLSDVSAGSGEVGEILVQGPNVMAGYWGLPEATSAAFAEGDWLRTGDAATVDDDGHTYVVDRVKDMFISGGENVYPAEVEQVLYQYPAVAECAVIGVADERWGEVGRAVVVLRAGREATEREILDFLDGKLARYKLPKSVVFADGLPRNAAGKLLKRRLRETYTRP
ncbi:acyl-CoA synthetase [Phytoactinopolyspora halotolerans]|uniref:Long-chain fatty acid--CoA ligase n=1 Tax=Phytoactinopolyspora halotolerans TaxID=1981512 RepID=A0A6L9SE93_9ACTN|nr:long-chain fatty acid--CoA ligase [Phytoactinopolyspora halotolerans]NEE02944.1 long-chain fatty acid--CoA ligase [Phytoactinopolyspora halotolerans]